MSDEYVLGRSYRNPPINSDEEGEFINRFERYLDTGLSPFNGIKCVRRQKGDLKDDKIDFLVLYSNPRTSSKNPWHDEIDLEKGRIRYWGDAKPDEEKEYDEYTGNQWLEEIYENYYLEARQKDLREKAPPILVFESPEKGQVKFCGICVLDKLRTEYFKYDGRISANYLAELSILNSREVSMEWIKERAYEGTNYKAPEAWKEWVKTGNIDRFTVHVDEIRSGVEQLPKSGEKRQMLEEIRNEFTESELEYLVKHLLEEAGLRNLRVQGGSGDRGVDLIGETGIFSGLDLSERDTGVPVKVQVKNYQLETSGGSINKVSPRHVSRLASRVNEGEIGLYISTCAYTDQAQRETFENYPVKLISGYDLAEMLHRSNLTDNYELTEDARKMVRDEISRNK